MVLARLDQAAKIPFDELSVRPTWPSISGFSAAWLLDLGTSDAAKLPTDERIRGFAGGNDPQLAALYFQFGRYLLISSSRRAASRPRFRAFGTTA